MGHKTLFQALCASTAIVAIAAPSTAFAQAQADFNLPAQDLGKSLRAVGRQTNTNIVFDPSHTSGKRAPALKGKYSAQSAVQKLLAASGLSMRNTGTGSLVITAGQPSGEALAGNAAADTVSVEEQRGVSEILVVGSRSQNVDIRRTEDDSQPYVVFDSREIERSAATNVEEFLKRRLMSENNVGVRNQFEGGGNVSSFSLRGLGPDETLILVDGRRIAGHRLGGEPLQGDVNGIPIEAIERIEVLPTTASGIFGGGATGGVINIILKRDYEGIRIGFEYGNTADFESYYGRIEASGGFALEDGRTRITFAGSVSDASELLEGERNFLVDARKKIAENVPGFFTDQSTPPLGYTTNIRSESGESLTLDNGIQIGSSITSVPVGYSGIASDGGAGLVANAGQYNLDLADTVQNFGAERHSIWGAPKVRSLLLSADRDFTKNLNIFAEVSISDNKQSFSTSSAVETYRMLADDPGNPFQQDIVAVVPALGTETSIKSRTVNIRLATGARLKISPEWSAALDYTWNLAKAEDLGPKTFDIDGARAAVSGGVIDIFKDVNQFDPSFDQFVGSVRTGSREPSKNTLSDVAFRVSGKLPMRFPGGKPVINASISRRSEHFDDQVFADSISSHSVSFSVSPARWQRISSAYAEASIPLFAAENGISGLHLLEMHGAVRYDHYYLNSAPNAIAADESGTPTAPFERVKRTLSSLDPTLSIRYAPTRDIMFRASYGTGFLPPSVAQLTAFPPTNVINPFIWRIFQIRDPERGNEFLGTSAGVRLVSGGNVELMPEESKSYSAGVILTPRWFPGFRASLDWTRIEKRSAISSLSQFNRDDVRTVFEHFPERVTRADPIPGDGFAVGPVTFLDFRLFNLSKQDVEALDVSASYTMKSAVLGQFSINLEASHFIDNREQAKPDADIVEFADTQGFLDWRAGLTATVEKSGWVLSWTATYYDGYYLSSSHSIDDRQGSAKVKSQVYNDIYLAYDFTNSDLGFNSLFRGLKAHIAVNNVFNSSPSFDVSSASGVSPLGDPRLRRFSLGLRKAF